MTFIYLLTINPLWTASVATISCAAHCTGKMCCLEIYLIWFGPPLYLIGLNQPKKIVSSVSAGGTSDPRFWILVDIYPIGYQREGGCPWATSQVVRLAQTWLKSRSGQLFYLIKLSDQLNRIVSSIAAGGPSDPSFWIPLYIYPIGHNLEDDWPWRTKL